MIPPGTREVRTDNASALTLKLAQQHFKGDIRAITLEMGMADSSAGVGDVRMNEDDERQAVVLKSDGEPDLGTTALSVHLHTSAIDRKEVNVLEEPVDDMDIAQDTFTHLYCMFDMAFYVMIGFTGRKNGNVLSSTVEGGMTIPPSSNSGIICELIVTFEEAGSEMTTSTKLGRMQRVPFLKQIVGAKYNINIFNFSPYSIPLDVAINSGRKSAPVQFGDPTFIMTHSPNVLPLNTMLSRPCSVGSACVAGGGSKGVGSAVAVTCSNFVTAFYIVSCLVGSGMTVRHSAVECHQS
ncbi:hypothetical protein F4604DRAFT_1678674 [Suillus subluteus]|nr:hypothetical protein F4604DRAFT_1678674 [Suillus subluteus]